MFFNSLPNIKILDQSNLRAFADNNINGGVRGCEVESPTRNHKVSSLIPGPEVNFGFSFAHTFGASTGVFPQKHNQERLE